VTLSGRGALAGRSLEDLRADVVLSDRALAPPEGELGPGEIVARAERGAYDVRRLTLRAPGLALDGAMRWRPRGAVSGRLVADAADLGAVRRNPGALLGGSCRPSPARRASRRRCPGRSVRRPCARQAPP
jgi:translocation and assembly module TamB